MAAARLEFEHLRAEPPPLSLESSSFVTLNRIEPVRAGVSTLVLSVSVQQAHPLVHRVKILAPGYKPAEWQVLIAVQPEPPAAWTPVVMRSPAGPPQATALQLHARATFDCVESTDARLTAHTLPAEPAAGARLQFEIAQTPDAVFSDADVPAIYARVRLDDTLHEVRLPVLPGRQSSDTT